MESDRSVHEDYDELLLEYNHSAARLRVNKQSVSRAIKLLEKLRHSAQVEETRIMKKAGLKGLIFHQLNGKPSIVVAQKGVILPDGLDTKHQGNGGSGPKFDHTSIPMLISPAKDRAAKLGFLRAMDVE